jgi:hypothetical protein
MHLLVQITVTDPDVAIRVKDVVFIFINLGIPIEVVYRISEPKAFKVHFPPQEVSVRIVECGSVIGVPYGCIKIAKSFD